MLDIQTPATDRSLLTVEELRAAAGVADSSRDVELAVVGEAVSDLIAEACQVARVRDIPPTLRAEELIETFRIPMHLGWSAEPYAHAAPLRPARRPIASVTSVEENGVTLGTTAYEIDGPAIYRLVGSYRGRWQHGPIVVVYTAGWDTVPAGLKWAARKFVQAMLLEDGRDPLLKRKVTVGVSEYEWWVDPTKDSVVPPEVMDILVRGGYVDRWAWLR